MGQRKIGLPRSSSTRCVRIRGFFCARLIDRLTKRKIDPFKLEPTSVHMFGINTKTQRRSQHPFNAFGTPLICEFSIQESNHHGRSSTNPTNADELIFPELENTKSPMISRASFGICSPDPDGYDKSHLRRNTLLEYTVQSSLERLGMSLKRVGGKSDYGIDLLGTWSTPSVPQPLKSSSSARPLPARLSRLKRGSLKVRLLVALKVGEEQASWGSWSRRSQLPKVSERPLAGVGGRWDMSCAVQMERSCRCCGIEGC